MRFVTKPGTVLTTATVAAALGLAAFGQPGLAAAQALPGGTWGPALAVNLTVTPPAGTYFAGGVIQDVSCASPGNCAAIGTYYSYTTAAGIYTPYPFVLSETDGTWAPAAVPGITSRPILGGPTATVSCAAPGECAASWTYTDANGDGHAYLINESEDAWGQAQPVTIGTVGTWLSGVSCPAVGDCTAVGDYLDGSAGSGLPFVMDSSAGTWGTPQEVPGVAGLSSPSPVNAGLASVSCTSVGNCVAGGSYHVSSTDNRNHGQPFLAIETGGSWGHAQPVAGMTTLNPADMANLSSVSCGGLGDCAAIGVYSNLTGAYDTWVADESGGNWGPARQLSAPAASSRTLPASLSCSPLGYCAVAGQYIPASSSYRKAFVASYANGAWTAQDVPGVVATVSMATAVSCGAPGYCTVGGEYNPNPTGSGSYRLFVANDVNGTWASAQDVAGVTGGLPAISGLSCTAPGYCTAVGMDGGTTFTMSEATEATITLQASAPTVTYGGEEAETLTATVTSPAGGTPTGTVTVTDGKLAACSITLTSGTGSCTLPATALPGGTAQLTATYSGDASYAAARSTAIVTVAKATTTPVMRVSPATVTFGTRYKAVVSVSVAPQFTGTPTGTLTIYLNGRAMCETPLTDGKAACAVPGGLNGGRYKITASYGGDGDFAASTAAARYLTVARERDSMRLALSRATITYGHETAEKFTVIISSPVPNRATGKVTLKAGRTTVCVITLKRGRMSTGSCTLKVRQLKPGRYQLTARYPGDGNYAPSNSASRSLKVAA